MRGPRKVRESKPLRETKAACGRREISRSGGRANDVERENLQYVWSLIESAQISRRVAKPKLLPEFFIVACRALGGGSHAPLLGRSAEAQRAQVRPDS